MKTTLTLSALALAAFGLAGCDETSMASDMAPSPMSPPFIETMDASVSDEAVSACMSSLEAQTDGNVSVVGSEFSEANTAIYMRVGTNGAPWRCLVGNDGSNPELMFMGSEGAA